MIYYLCTYPRSGNSFLQQLVYGNLLRLPTQFDAGGKAAPAWIEKWDYRPAPSREEGWPDGLLWNSFTGTYLRKKGMAEKTKPTDRHRMIGPLGHHQFTDDMRAALAKESDRFFIKSHNPPYEKYFDGECVIQVMRHPGPTIWSYYRYLHRINLRDNRSNAAIILDDVIEGAVLFGGWADNHSNFLAAEKELGPRFLRFDYADLLRDEVAAGRRLAEFCGLEYYEGKRVDFAAYDRKMVGFGSRGTNAGYEQYYSKRQLARMWEKHGERATSFGYQPPDFDAGCADDQVERLSEMVRVLSTLLADANQKLGANRNLIKNLTNGMKKRITANSRASE